MTTQIDVVGINDNTVTEEVKEVKPKKPQSLKHFLNKKFNHKKREAIASLFLF